ncbi:hypothetical protein KJ940_19365, partial [Myxococcota bacterium]|nr:hypothetical protein [Myxococcota bacterium]
GGMSGICLTHEDCPPGALCDIAAQACATACRLDDDCGPTARCAPEGLCRDLPLCADDGDCQEGVSACDCHGVCAPTTGRRCTTDLQCGPDSFCEPCSASCKPRVAPCGRCEINASNPSVNGGCERHADFCYPLGEAAQTYCLRPCTGGRQGTCESIGPGYQCEVLGDGREACVPSVGECVEIGDCLVDTDCDSASFCNDFHFCQPGCRDDIACPQGQVCHGLRCGPACATDSDCEAGEACQPDGHCRRPGFCQTSRDCPEAETHCDLESHQCAPGCELDDDCLDATQECLGGACRPRGCTGNFQCAFGEVCDLDSHLCQPAPGRHCEAGCDPQQSETSCGDTGQRCLSLQDEDGNALGDFCFEPCLEAPNACPQGYQCVDLEDQDGNVSASLCIRRCDLDPFRTQSAEKRR